MFGPFDWTDTYKLDYTNSDTRAAMIDAMSYWLREADIDGFRCDVAGQVPVEFWNECRPALEKTKKDIFMLAEATEPFLMERAFDMDYNWPMKDLQNRIACAAGQYKYVAEGDSVPRHLAPAHAKDIVTLLNDQAVKYPAGSIMMNMITNHDLNSWEGTEFQRYGTLCEAMAVLTFTMPGMPLIYTGQETGMDRAFQFFVKDTSPQWEPRNEFFKFYKNMCALKHSRPELSVMPGASSFNAYDTDDWDILVFSRVSGSSVTFVGVNLGPTDKAVTFTKDAPSLDGAVNYLTGEKVSAFPARLKSGEYFIYTIN
jgi:glycosidase